MIKNIIKILWIFLAVIVLACVTVFFSIAKGWIGYMLLLKIWKTLIISLLHKFSRKTGRYLVLIRLAKRTVYMWAIMIYPPMSSMHWLQQKMCVLPSIPELMQLLSGKSMIRYFPPKDTAGFATSEVSTPSLLPCPPASSMAIISFLTIKNTSRLSYKSSSSLYAPYSGLAHNFVRIVSIAYPLFSPQQYS